MWSGPRAPRDRARLRWHKAEFKAKHSRHMLRFQTRDLNMLKDERKEHGKLPPGQGHSQVTHKKGSWNLSGHTGPYSPRNSPVERYTQESRQAKGFGGEAPSRTAQGSEPNALDCKEEGFGGQSR